MVAMVNLECCVWTPKAGASGHGATSRVIDGPTCDFGNDLSDSFFDDGTFGISAPSAATPSTQTPQAATTAMDTSMTVSRRIFGKRGA